jgi:hypothetical protein
LSIEEANVEKSLAEKESLYEHVVERGEQYFWIGAWPGGRGGQTSSCGHDERGCTGDGSFLEWDSCPVGTAEEEKSGKALADRKPFYGDVCVVVPVS